MVQSPRLKISVHPLLPVLTVIFLLLVTLFIIVPEITRQGNSKFNSYATKRETLLIKYNSQVDQLKFTLEFKYLGIEQFSVGLEKASVLISNLNQIHTELSSLNTGILSSKLSKTQTSEVRSNLESDSARLLKLKTIDETIDNKLEAIKVSDTIKSLTYCFRKVRNKYELLECKNIYEGVTKPANITEKYKQKATYLLNNYFLLSFSEKKSRINEITLLHNGMNKELEKLINTPIIY